MQGSVPCKNQTSPKKDPSASPWSNLTSGSSKTTNRNAQVQDKHPCINHSTAILEKQKSWDRTRTFEYFSHHNPMFVEMF
mmetsp:Transcript_2634/g.5666  ORF Transcript_2634/g.5666 Transcript_2634/m.5666 type:complete len:80 (+) Transcript_2634:120-359(+)